MTEAEIDRIVEKSVQAFKRELGWKASFIDDEDVQKYRDEIRRVIREVRAKI